MRGRDGFKFVAARRVHPMDSRRSVRLRRTVAPAGVPEPYCFRIAQPDSDRWEKKTC